MASTEIRRSFPAGALIFEEGAPGDCAYIIESGSIEISIRRDDRDVVIARRGAGEIFGEMAIIDAAPRSATVRAVENCRLLVLTEEQVQGRLADLDPVMRMLLGVVLDRFRDSISGVRPTSEHGSLPSGGRRDGLIRTAIARIEIEQELREGIAAGQLEFLHQPINRSIDLQIAGYEALARWRHPERGLLGPGAFIPVAEESGLIAEISRCAVAAACRDAMRLRRERAPHLFVSANVTADDICDPAFFDHTATCLEISGLAPDGLFLEITETTLIENAEQTIDMLERYRSLGVGVKIDDFGAGYSNFSYLPRYPVQSLKIDRSVVTQLNGADGKGADVVSMIASMATMLGLKTVAEGVETEWEAEKLRALGCDYLQGYYFGKPAPLFPAEAADHTQPAAASGFGTLSP